MSIKLVFINYAQVLHSNAIEELFVTLDHKTNHKGHFYYASSGSLITNISIGVWFVRTISG